MNENFYYFLTGLGLYFLVILIRIILTHCTCCVRTHVVIADDIRQVEEEEQRRGGEHVILLTEVEGKEDLEDLCSICYVTFADKKTIKTECGHIYHKECLLQWLGSNQNQSRKCPLCLNSLSL